MMNHVEGNFQIVISEEKFAVKASILDQFTVESQFAEGEREREICFPVFPFPTVIKHVTAKYCEVIPFNEYKNTLYLSLMN